MGLTDTTVGVVGFEVLEDSVASVIDECCALILRKTAEIQRSGG